jgi:hypothetical protein
MMLVAEKIQASGVSDKTISEATGLPIPTVWRWRTGKGLPNLVNVSALARAIRCHPADLIPPERD